MCLHLWPLQILLPSVFSRPQCWLGQVFLLGLLLETCLGNGFVENLLEQWNDRSNSQPHYKTRYCRCAPGWPRLGKGGIQVLKSRATLDKAGQNVTLSEVSQNKTNPDKNPRPEEVWGKRRVTDWLGFSTCQKAFWKELRLSRRFGRHGSN